LVKKKEGRLGKPAKGEEQKRVDQRDKTDGKKENQVKSRE